MENLKNTDKWAVVDRETGTLIELCASIQEAERILQSYEEEDEKEGIFEENFYKIKKVEN